MILILNQLIVGSLSNSYIIFKLYTKAKHPYPEKKQNISLHLTNNQDSIGIQLGIFSLNINSKSSSLVAF